MDLLPHLILGFFFLPVFFFLVTLDGSDWERFKLSNRY